MRKTKGERERGRENIEYSRRGGAKQKRKKCNCGVLRERLFSGSNLSATVRRETKAGDNLGLKFDDVRNRTRERSAVLHFRSKIIPCISHGTNGVNLVSFEKKKRKRGINRETAAATN